MELPPRRAVADVVIGQDAVVDRIFIALFTGGHLLLQGVPGLAKTLPVNAMARAISLDFGRVQFTVDLLPSDILGAEVLDPKSGGPPAALACAGLVSGAAWARGPAPRSTGRGQRGGPSTREAACAQFLEARPEVC